VGAADVAALLDQGVEELHVALPEPGDLGEDEAAARLAAALAGRGVCLGAAHAGQVTLTSGLRGLLRVRATVLETVNQCPGVLAITGLPDCAADAGISVAVVKCAPLYLDAATIAAVERVAATDGPLVEVVAFRPLRVAFVAVEDRLRGSAFDRASASLARALEWHGASMPTLLSAPASAAGLAAAYRQALADGAELVLAAGASATDPLDVMFQGLRQAGGAVEQAGIPLEPGTACWFGNLGGVPVLGLASCELFGRAGALDLLLPRLLAGEALDAALVRRLALGGLVVGGPTRILPSHAADGV
jgi:molybdenum cofactor cytidylyltransferase